MTTDIDWRRVAVRLALAGDGTFRLLSTRERDELEQAVETAIDEEWIAEDTAFERTADAASGMEGS